MLLEIDPVQPEPWLLVRAIHALRRGGVVVVPTDTVYGLTCSIGYPAAIERIYALKDMDPKKPLSMLVADLRMASRFAKGISTPVYRMMKRVLPGPYTFIFVATAEVPKVMLRRRKTIGIRIPDNAIALALLEELGEPLLTTSIRTPEDEIVNDPEEIERTYDRRIDLVVDGGPLLPVPSTVVDFSSGEPVLIRQGRGDVATLEIFD